MNTFEDFFKRKNEEDQAEGLTIRQKRMRRVVAPLATAALVLGAGITVNNSADADSPTNHAVINTTTQDFNMYTVKTGDTVFDISKRAEPGTDPRDTSDLILNTIEENQGINRAEAIDIQPGEQVALPDGAKVGQHTEVIYLGEK